ncbi:MAG: sensor histidine kinase, partial [Cytophagales bacterium]|nr:sensor histidine kinase [Cytophagales bacterium]
MRFAIVLLSCLHLAAVSVAQSVPAITRTDSLYNLTSQSRFFIDSTAALSFVQAQATPFRPYDTKTLQRADWRDVVWFKVTVNNPTDLPSTWLLHTGKASFVDVFIRQPDGRFVQKKSGYYRTNAERDELRAKENSVHITLRPGTNEWYVRYENQLRIPIGPRLLLQPTDSWNEFIIERNLYEGIAQGVLLVLFLYNILLFFILKRRTYLFYSLYIFALAVFYLNVYNLGRELLLGGFPRIFDFNWAALQGVVIFLLLFISHFLNTAERFPRIHRNIRWLIVANVAWGVAGSLYLFVTKDLASIFFVHRYFNMVQFVNVLVLLGFFWVSRTRLARYLVLSTLPLILGGLWDVVFRNASDVTRVHINYFQVGAIVQLVLFSLCIGYKLRDEERKRRRAKEKLIRQLRENEQLKDKLARSLEKKVQQRTAELQAANENLAALNSEKARILSIVAHDLNAPLNALKGMLQIFENNLLTEKELRELAPVANRDVHHVAGLLNNLLVWARSQMSGAALQPSLLDLHSLADETLQLLHTAAESKGVRLYNRVDGSPTAHADEETIKLVLRNLVSNAIKFTTAGGAVTVTATARGSQVEIAVQDTGKGIRPENMEKLFGNEPFTLRGTA